MQFRLLTGGALFTLFAAALAEAPAQPGGGKVYATPQAVYAAIDKAGRMDDWKTVYTCLTPGSREALTGQVFVTGVVVKSFKAPALTPATEKTVKAIDATFKKYGITKDALDKIMADKIDLDAPKERAASYRKYAAKVKEADRAAFVADMLKAIDEGKKNKPGGKGALKDLKIEGDTARGIEVQKGEDGTEKSDPITFKKVGGGWLVEMPLERPPPKKAPKAPVPTPPKE